MKYYPNTVLWWNSYVKKRKRQTSQREEASRNRDRKDMEDFYYTAIYHALQSPPTTENLVIAIRLKAKILYLQSKHMRGVLMDTDDNDGALNEEITTYHYIRSRKRSKARMVSNILDHQGQTQTDQDSIMRKFKKYIDLKYCNIQSDICRYKKLISCGIPQIVREAKEELDLPITMDELHDAVRKGKRNKAPGSDGLCHEFYKKSGGYHQE